MRQLGFEENYSAYLNYLHSHREESARLVNLFWINYSGFFRDREVWDGLEARFLPTLLAAKAPEQPIRVWSAGCASGQEAYSLAMLLGKFMTREELQRRVTIYATDVDRAALDEAKQAYYSLEQVQGIVASPLIEEYFERRSGSWRFRQEKICPVIFSQHNLLTDPPLKEIDLMLCRNVLIYFNPEYWKRVLTSLGSALSSRGLLVLGKAESPQLFSSSFCSLDYSNRIFSKRV
jgi:two-component system CheB/CheR fusion protein